MEQLSLFAEEYQPRFQAYLDHIGATHPEEVNMRHFIAWISGHAEDFKQANNIGTLNGRHEGFTKYVEGMVQK